MDTQTVIEFADLHLQHSIKGNENKLIIHRIIQQVMRLQSEKENKQIIILRKILNLLNNHIDNTNNSIDVYIKHEIHVWKHLSKEYCKCKDIIEEFSET